LTELFAALREVEKAGDGLMLLDFQGRGVGNIGGDLSLLQIGLPSKTFMVDAVALDDDLGRLAPFLQSRNIRKVVWDGRSGYAELWHRYAIRLENVLDLQLVYLHDRYDLGARKSVAVSGKLGAIRQLGLLPVETIDSDLKSTSQSPHWSKLISDRQLLDQTQWNKRPLPNPHLDSATTNMADLRLLAKSLIPRSAKLSNILRESKRYIESWHRHRRDPQNPYQSHNYLPQGIIERTESERGLKALGLRRCRGCTRDYYQGSFALDFRRWGRNPEKQFCHTCAKVNLRRYRRNRFLDVMELARSRTSSPNLILSEQTV
jgi:hypothetical protein